MSSNEEAGPGVIGVATGGIQDVSALLPLLGTEQCEHLVTSAIRDGLLYAAATPMSIFGSLGIVKGGFIVLWGSVDNRYFSGPLLLRNAGFKAGDMAELLTPVVTDNVTDSGHLYVAEKKLLRHLSEAKIRSVEVNLLSKGLWKWNLLLIGATAMLSSLGVLPYVYLIRKTLSGTPLRTTWLYPAMRVVGCSTVAICIQFIFQLRLLEEVYWRVCFYATDRHLTEHGPSVPVFWDPSRRSKSVIARLRDDDTMDSPLFLERTGRFTSFRFRVDSPHPAIENTPREDSSARGVRHFFP